MSTKLVASPKSGAFWRERRKEQQWRQAGAAGGGGGSGGGGSSRVHSSTAFHLPKLALGRVCVSRRCRWRRWRWRAAVDPVWTAVTATASLLCCVSPPSLPRRRRRHLAASVQLPPVPPAPLYTLCHQAPSYSMLLTDLPAVTISGFEASHNGRNIWVKIWYNTRWFFDFGTISDSCFVTFMLLIWSTFIGLGLHLECWI